MISRICGIQKKNDTNKLMYKTETDSQTQKSMITKGKIKVVWDKLRVWD